MNKVITRLKLHNFRRFRKFDVGFNNEMNLLIGDNESGKSSILQSLDLVMSGSRSKVETLGLESLMNTDVISEFFVGSKSYKDLPVMWIEVYLNEQNNPDLNGKNNSEGIVCDGLKLICEPMAVEYGAEIADILKGAELNFPFEYYSINFKTFSGEFYTGYRRFMKHLLLDGSQINNEYATREYVKEMYRAKVDDREKHKHRNEYRKHKSQFRNNVLSELNDRLDSYKFSVATNTKSNLETDLTITEDDISIENKGKGRQCFIKTEFALHRSSAGNPLDVLLLEEPENHLSHTNMKNLVGLIAGTKDKQLIVTTHNSLICTRLDLRKAIMLNSSSDGPTKLNILPDDTAGFFVKAPDNNILEFILSKKVVLVEGDAEYLLMEAFYKSVTGKELNDADFHVISVGGTSFKRYLELGKLLNIKTAVIRDNDGNFQKNCIDRYKDYESEDIKVFYERDDTLKTFEICMYETNKKVCEDLFTTNHIKLSAQDYMLGSKTEAAFRLLENKSAELIAPEYIRNAITWITE
ncbi:MAG: TOPRIM nucleotidyl transferase/hydrolase domain-containing protein [Candidatus Nitrotoga sp.]